jgi:hypothetical protein
MAARFLSYTSFISYTSFTSLHLPASVLRMASLQRR